MCDLTGALAVDVGQRGERARDLQVEQAPPRLGYLVIRGGAYEIVAEIPFAAHHAQDRAPLELADRARELGERDAGDRGEHVSGERGAERGSPRQELARGPLGELETLGEQLFERVPSGVAPV